MASNPSSSNSNPAPLVKDPTKGISLFFGILFALASCSLAESIKMLYLGSRAGLIELIVFSLLVIDAFVLLATIRIKSDGPPGFFQYLSVWILGLIPYFGWLAIDWVGKKITEAIQQRGKAPAIALILFIGIMGLCLCVYLFVASDPTVQNFPSQR